MKPTWIYQPGVFNTKKQPFADELFVAALKRHHLTVLEVPNNLSPFSQSSNTIRKAVLSPYTFRGSFRFSRQQGLNYNLGLYEYDLPNFNCSTWLTHFGNYSLNSKYLVLSLSELWRRKAEILPYFYSSGTLFIRPDSGLKQFHGAVIDLTHFQTLDQFCNYLKQTKDFKVLVAPSQTIDQKYRFFCKGLEVITGTIYPIEGTPILFPTHHENVSIISSEVQTILKTVNWTPSSLWSINVTLKQSKLSVIGLGFYHCSGVYSSDLDKYIEVANDYALKTYNSQHN